MMKLIFHSGKLFFLGAFFLLFTQNIAANPLSEKNKALKNFFLSPSFGLETPTSEDTSQAARQNYKVPTRLEKALPEASVKSLFTDEFDEEKPETVTELEIATPETSSERQSVNEWEGQNPETGTVGAIESPKSSPNRKSTNEWEEESPQTYIELERATPKTTIRNKPTKARSTSSTKPSSWSRSEYKSTLTPPKKTVNMRLRDAFNMALKKNLNIQVQRLAPVSSTLDIEDTKAGFDPTMTQSITFAGDPVAKTSSSSGATSVSKKFLMGSTLGLEMANSKSSSQGQAPTYKTTLTPSITVPLLSGFGYEVNEAPIIIAEKNRSNSRLSLRNQMESTLLSVNTAYWNLQFSIEEFKIQRENLRQTLMLQEKTQIMINEGRLAALELFQTEAAVSRREEAVLVAKQNKENAEDTLLKLLNAEYSYQINPIEKPKVLKVSMNYERSLFIAKGSRTDYLQAKQNREINKINLKVAKNNSLPELSLTGSYSVASDDAAGGFGQSFRDVNKNRSWSVGLTFTTPIPNTTKNNALSKARINLRQTDLGFSDLDEKIQGEVRNAIRALETSEKRMEVTEKSRILSEKKLEAEEIKFFEGLSDNFTVITFQNDLVSAKIAEKKAVKDFQIAVLALKNVEGVLLDFLHIKFAEENEKEKVLYEKFKSN